MPSAAPSAGSGRWPPPDAASPSGPFAQPRTFFYDLLRGLQDLDLHLLLAQQPFELTDPLMGFPQGTHRHDILVRGDGRRGAGFEASLPLTHHAGLDIQLAGDLRQGLLAFQQLLDDTPLELHGEDASAIRLPWKLAHEALPSCRSRIAPSVSSSIGEQIRCPCDGSGSLSLSLSASFARARAGVRILHLGVRSLV